MKQFLIIIIYILNHFVLSAQQDQLINNFNIDVNVVDTRNVMSTAYWELWNPEVQKKIDADIEKYRKANAVLKFEDLEEGSEIRIEQISQDFIFGANIFNFNQLGSIERNLRYKNLFGSLFNSATVPFYWKPFEMQPNRLRFREEYWDTEEFWNQILEPESRPHWRRPATDAIVNFCEEKSVRLHGHPMVWSAPRFHPDWMFEQFCPQNEKEIIEHFGHNGLKNLTNSKIAELLPGYTDSINRLFWKRIIDLSNYYGNRIQSWDIVNESRSDFRYQKTSLTGDKICLAQRGQINLMPGDYAYHSFKLAEKNLPNNVLLNINDNVQLDTSAYDDYTTQIKDLLLLGCRIDIIGSQMHLFKPSQGKDIAVGANINTPSQIWAKMKKLAEIGLPIHLSEVTIPSPEDNEYGNAIQAVIVENLYRIWFSIENMMGITWWNVVDECGEPGQVTTSGLFTRDMEPKPSFYILNRLINKEWKTIENIKTVGDGIATFRGFKGEYIVSWRDKFGDVQQERFYLKNDGDGF